MEQLPAIYQGTNIVPANQMALDRIINAVKVVAVYLYTRGKTAINCQTITLLTEQVEDLRRQNVLLMEQNSKLTEAARQKTAKAVPSSGIAKPATKTAPRTRTTKKKIAA